MFFTVLACSVGGLGAVGVTTETASAPTAPEVVGPSFVVGDDLVVLASGDALWVLEHDDARVDVDGVSPGEIFGFGRRYAVTTDPVAGAFSVVDVASEIAEHVARCGAGGFEGALPWGDDVLVLCGDAPSYRLDAAGARTNLSIEGTRWLADAGRPYVVDAGQEGTFLQELDPADYEAIGQGWWLGYTADVEGDWFVSIDDPYYGDEVDIHLVPRVGALRDVPASSVNGAAFVVASDGVAALTLVDHLDVGGGPAPRWWGLLDEHGYAWDGGLETCALPALRVVAPDQIEGWCAEPVRRYRWSWDGTGWVRVDEHAFPDAARVTLIEG